MYCNTVYLTLYIQSTHNDKIIHTLGQSTDCHSVFYGNIFLHWMTI